MLRTLLVRLKERHPTLYQFISFAVVGGIVTVVDFALFALGRYLLFTPWLTRDFSFWLFDYPVEKGGLCAFLAFVISFPLAQIVSFLLQRRMTFRANNNPIMSALLFSLLIFFIFLVNMYLPVLTLPPLTRLLGPALAGSAAKCVNMTVSMLIEFPVDKFFIMKRSAINK